MPRAWLIGMMGSGKSVVGRRLAEKLDIDFFDTDALVERLIGRSIEEVWAEEGEEAFRRLESICITQLAEMEGVVSTGGGAVLDPQNVETMRSSGPVVWLRATVETLTLRLGAGRHRPLLADGDIGQRLVHLVSEREPVYRQAASAAVDTDHLTTEAVVRAVEAVL